MDDLGDDAAANSKDVSECGKVGQGAADVGKGAVEATKGAVDSGGASCRPRA